MTRGKPPFAAWEARVGLTSPSRTAVALNISRQAVDLLRKGERNPSGSTLRLMQVLEDNPELLQQLLPRRGRPSRYSDNQTIKLLVDKNPKRPGTKAYEEFKYRDGMTVAAFKAAVGDPAYALSAIRWDVDHGFIAIGPPSD
jgi:transcriptional regulator with XRE-family HTH domain